jgi:hypothetical protein
MEARRVSVGLTLQNGIHHVKKKKTLIIFSTIFCPKEAIKSKNHKTSINLSAVD